MSSQTMDIAATPVPGEAGLRVNALEDDSSSEASLAIIQADEFPAMIMTAKSKYEVVPGIYVHIYDMPTASFTLTPAMRTLAVQNQYSGTDSSMLRAFLCRFAREANQLAVPAPLLGEFLLHSFPGSLTALLGFTNAYRPALTSVLQALLRAFPQDLDMDHRVVQQFRAQRQGSQTVAAYLQKLIAFHMKDDGFTRDDVAKQLILGLEESLKMHVERQLLNMARATGASARRLPPLEELLSICQQEERLMPTAPAPVPIIWTTRRRVGARRKPLLRLGACQTIKG